MNRARPSLGGASAPAPAPAGRRGFSLLEVLLAVALATMLLIAVNFFVLSMGELWGGGSEERLFDRHVRGVTRFLEALVEQSVVPTQDLKRPAADAPPQTSLAPRNRPAPAESPRPVREEPPRYAALVAGLAGARSDGPFAVAVSESLDLGRRLGRLAVWALGGPAPADQGGRGRLPRPVRDANPQHPPVIGDPRGTRPEGGQPTDAVATTGTRFRFGTPSGYDGSPPMLMFEIDEAPGQCVWPQRPLPQVECALQINADEGLVLLWKSKLEEDYGKARPRKTQLSPFGRRISYDYYDADRKAWTHSEQPQADNKGGWLVPQRVRITFAYQGMEREVSITLPDVPGGAPLR